MTNNRTADIVVPWNQVVRGDLVVVDGKWWKVDAIFFRYVHVEDEYDDDGNWTDPWSKEDRLKNRDIEKQLVDHINAETDYWMIPVRLKGIEYQVRMDIQVEYQKTVRIRPVGSDPWEGRRKEGQF